jgi:hypothetical protein
MQSTERPRASTAVLPDPFPYVTEGLSDQRWSHHVIDLILPELPQLTEEGRQIFYETLIDLRLWVFRQVTA